MALTKQTASNVKPMGSMTEDTNRRKRKLITAPHHQQGMSHSQTATT